MKGCDAIMYQRTPRIGRYQSFDPVSWVATTYVHRVGLVRFAHSLNSSACGDDHGVRTTNVSKRLGHPRTENQTRPKIRDSLPPDAVHLHVLTCPTFYQELDYLPIKVRSDKGRHNILRHAAIRSRRMSVKIISMMSSSRSGFVFSWHTECSW